MNSKRFRYWMARLRPIATPQAWMPLVGAGMVGSFMWVAYQSPESLSFIGGDKGASESEASSIGADIDSVSVLMQELDDRKNDNLEDPNAVLPNAVLPNAVVQTKGNKLSPIALKTSPATQTDAAKDGSSGASFAQLVRFTPEGNAVNSGQNSSPNSGPNSNPNSSPTALAQNALFTRSDAPRSNPLAQAIDRLTGQPSGQGFYNSGLNHGFNSGFNSSPESGINQGSVPIEGTGFVSNAPAWTGIPTGGTTGLTTATPPIVPQPSGYGNPNAANYSNNAYTYLTGMPSGYSSANTGVATPIAPVGISNPNAGINSAGINSAGLNSGVVTPLPMPGSNASETMSLPSEQPFSAPRPIPGRMIGGGNINTFSNP
jgi:hypothetical protein